MFECFDLHVRMRCAVSIYYTLILYFFESIGEFITVAQDIDFESTGHFLRENVYAHGIAGNKGKKDKLWVSLYKIFYMKEFAI